MILPEEVVTWSGCFLDRNKSTGMGRGAAQMAGSEELAIIN